MTVDSKALDFLVKFGSYSILKGRGSFPFYLRRSRAGLGLLCEVLVVVVIFFKFFCSIILKTTSYKNLYENKVVDSSEKGHCAKFEHMYNQDFCRKSQKQSLGFCVFLPKN